MKTYDAANIRNLALLGHQSVGKTTLAESILFHTGAIARMGSVDEGTSNLDYHHQEIERKISIYTSLGATEHEKTKFNLIDTPGVEDFRGEVIGALSVVESAMILARADAGVEVGTETLWESVEAKGLPAVLVISRMDKEKADFQGALAQIRERISNKAIAVQLPIGEGESLKGIVDVAAGEAWTYENPGQPQKAEIPAEMKDAYDEAREELLNAAAEHDDALVEKFLEEGDLTYEEILQGIQIGVRDRSFFPVCAVSATSGVGIKPLLHAIKEYLPSAAARQELRSAKEDVALKAGADAPLLARVFKVDVGRETGDLALLRVFGGTLAAGAEAYNVGRSHGERMTQLFSLEGKNREKIESIPAGDFGAAVKLKDTHAGDTLGEKSLPAPLAPFEYPKPNSRVTLRPVNQGDEDKMAQGLHRIQEEDPTIQFGVDSETHEFVLQGAGELHFDVVLNKLKERYNVDTTTHPPKIPYLETIKTSVEVHARHKKQTGGRGQFADVHLRFEPTPRGSGFEFVNAIVGGAVPGKFIPAVEKGLRESMARGFLAKSQVVDVKVTLFDGGFHAVDSSEAAFKTAAWQALKECFQKAKPALLEPIYQVEIKCPEEVMGDVMGDLSSRRGRIQGSEMEGHFQKVKAHIPLAELYRYSTMLRSITQGRGTYALEFDHYEEVPGDQMNKIIEETQKEAQEA